MTQLNETHDPASRSWVDSANQPDSDFPIQNLPFAVFRRKGSQESWRGGVAIGEQIVDLALAARHPGVFEGMALEAARAGSQATLNALMALGPAAWSALRLALSRALRASARAAQRAALETTLIAQAQAEYTVPARIGDYTDFYTSLYHATNIGKQFRPDNPLMPNFKWLPVGYHGRASSIGVSGQPVQRPVGQQRPLAEGQPPVFGPCQRLDYELELGVYIGPGNAQGQPIPLGQAESHVFGLCLLNDWSARDIQAWEYQPLGPFLSKNFATTVSPWIVTLEALAPYRALLARPAGDPQPLPYLDSTEQRTRGALDIQLELTLQTEKMRTAGQAPARVALSNYRHAYWTVAQMVAHHTVGGCNLQPGDFLGTGTLSGPTLDQACALIETTGGGKTPFRLPDGQTRSFLEDGDTVIIRGWCQKAGAARIGFGQCRGTILPARVTG
ncbi:MAG: fumarylacetoacetase [Burkholderiaceae bacterium]|nr:fumarylacetoacetase [Burkholderiaceae bacterium]